MQRFFSVFVILAIAAAGGVYLYQQQADTEAMGRAEKALASARRAFAEQARSAIQQEERDAYLNAIKQALKTYEAALKSEVYEERPDLYDIESMKLEMDTQLEQGNITEAQHKGMRERFELVKTAYETLMEGTWNSNLSLRGHGETRLDIYDVHRIRGPDGNPLLEAKFFLWGVEANTRLSFGDLLLEYWEETEPDAKIRRQRRREGRDPNAPALRPLGRAEGDATPVIIDQQPAKTIAQFPSYVTIGTLWLPQVPREAKVMDLRYAYSARKGGEDHVSQLAWTKMPIPSQWRLGQGEAWMAEEVEATEEELAGVDPEAPDAGVETPK